MAESAAATADLHALEENGYAVIRNFISPCEVELLVTEIEEHVAATGAEGQAGLEAFPL